MRGKEIVGWIACEMALCEDPIIWDHSQIASLQLSHLELIIADGRHVSILTHQNDDDWGLYIPDLVPQLKIYEFPQGIFWNRALDNIPVGIISDVKLQQSDSLMTYLVRFSIGNKIIEIAAGEIYERVQSLEIVTPDESILLTVDNKKPKQRRPL